MSIGTFRSPLESLYQLGDKVNKWMKSPGKIGNKKIISIGNLTTGGTGKTPAAIYICKLLESLGVKPAILTRGYGGTIYKEGGILSDGKSLLLSEVESGDEPYLLAMNLPGVPIAVGRRRHQNGLGVDQKFNPDVYVLDDGFQHYALHRDLDIVLIDAVNPFGNGHILPHGTLREPLSALQRSHVLILTKSDLIEPEKKEQLLKKLAKISGHDNIFEATHSPTGLVKLPVSYMNEPNKKIKLESLSMIKNSSCWALSGIGNHRAFEKTIANLGASEVRNISYRDHHRYSEKDILSILKRAGENELLLTTEKDWIRMQYFSDSLAQLKKFYFLKIEFKIQSKEKKLRDIISQIC
ncbi:MAG: tetraacyldisaccharide 4'-kinase [Leptospirales bacterium]